MPHPHQRFRSDRRFSGLATNARSKFALLPKACVHAGSVLLALALTWPVTSQAAPRPVVADYQVGYNGFSASGQLRIAPHGSGRWLASLRFGNLLASLEQATVFDIAQSRIRPLGGSRVVEAALTRRTIATRFDWRAAKATWSGDVKPRHRGPVPLQARDVDPLLFQLVIVDDLSAGRPTRYRVLDNGRAHVLAYRPLRAERITAGGRSYLASKLFAAEGSKRYVVWIAPGVPVPLRVLQSEVGGDTIDMRLTALH